ncbi:N-acetyl-beta-hexosaminidase [Tritrichomonas foetus]|uniref:beta-N-acetylhexosaminidase n=1 Tax=Tritrichomonas foetus TaxID=1144522 RepID=A0A1J4JYY0_9EUKA|nr:N-acetyl-beta-hexosaminidase [Tritrichomonas foetus]|eukprot:OHT04179.1 N-acetyl-beta-hexosaminidase [Tritrichomonas foetus]
MLGALLVSFALCRRLPPALVPQPKVFELDEEAEDTWSLTKSTVLTYPADVEGVVDAVNYFARIVRVSTGFPLDIYTEEKKKSIKLTLNSALPKEGYTVDVAENGVTIKASTSAGFFYGLQTLLQLLPVEIYSKSTQHGFEWEVPLCHVQDEPRFGWRGIMLDVSRHFFDKDSIKKLLDAMAIQKLNVFHWHLCDDQGWRIEIKKYPNFHLKGSKGAYRPVPWHNDVPDNVPYGPYYYTQEEVKEIIAYAKQRAITIVPEIEMPGHALGGLAGYPEISCNGGDLEPLPDFSGTIEVYCPGNDLTFTILQGVLDEVMELFDSEYIHTGGDECVKTRWQSCPKCQKRMKDQGLSTYDQLQSWFVQQMANYLESKGRHLIGWDEILEGGLASGAAVMSWRGTSGGIAAAKMGHNVVMSPNTHYYLDHAQFPVDDAYQYICCLKPLYVGYSYNPTDGIEEEYHKYIIGVQGNQWTEYVWGEDYDMQYKIFPRACAIAEVGWSLNENKDWNRFLTNMVRSHSKRLQKIGVYAAPLSLAQGAYWAPENITTQYTTRTWKIPGGIGNAGPYQVAFILTGGTNKLSIHNVNLLFDDEVVASDPKEGIASWDQTGTNIWTLNTKESGKGKEIKIQADVAGVDGAQTYGEIVIYYTSTN